MRGAERLAQRASFRTVQFEKHLDRSVSPILLNRLQSDHPVQHARGRLAAGRRCITLGPRPRVWMLPFACSFVACPSVLRRPSAALRRARPFTLCPPTSLAHSLASHRSFSFASLGSLLIWLNCAESLALYPAKSLAHSLAFASLVRLSSLCFSRLTRSLRSARSFARPFLCTHRFCHIINDNGRCCVPVVHWRQRVEPLLACSIPDLKLDYFIFESALLGQESSADGWLLVHLEVVGDEAQNY